MLGFGEATYAAPERSAMKRNLVLVVVIAILAVAGFVSFTVINTPTVQKPSIVTSSSSSSTSISSSSDAILAPAAQSDPSGFTPESSIPDAHVGGALSASWAELGQSDGSVANLTVVVYPSANASQAYFGRLVANVRGLPGYTDVTQYLASYQRYGECYGYGEDVDSIGVVNGFCTEGNVFLQVHLVSGVAFSTLEAYLTSLMGALYST